MCLQLAAAMPVDIMPGPSDPANFSLPQQVYLLFHYGESKHLVLTFTYIYYCLCGCVDRKICIVMYYLLGSCIDLCYFNQPLNRCLFPGASAYNTFISCTNPHQFELDDIQ